MTGGQVKADRHEIDVFGCTNTSRGCKNKRMGKMWVHKIVYKAEKQSTNQSGRFSLYLHMYRQ